MKMNLKRVFAVLVLMLFAALLVLPFFSCGAKKTETSKKEEIQMLDYSALFRNSWNSQELLNFESNLKINSFITYDEESEKTTIKKVFSPINSAITATYTDEKGNKHELNNTSYTEEKVLEKNKKNSQNSRKSDETLKSNFENSENSENSVSEKVAAKNKKSDNKNSSSIEQWKLPNWIRILIFFILFFLSVYLNKKYNWVKYVTAFFARLFQFCKK